MSWFSWYEQANRKMRLKIEDEVELGGVDCFAVIEGLAGPGFNNDVLVQGVEEAEAAQPLILVLDLHEVRAQLQVSVEDLHGLVQAEQHAVVVGLEAKAGVGTEQ